MGLHNRTYVMLVAIWLQMMVNRILSLVVNSFKVIHTFMVGNGTSLPGQNCIAKQLPGAQFLASKSPESTFGNPYTSLIYSSLKQTFLSLIFITRLEIFKALRFRQNFHTHYSLAWHRSGAKHLQPIATNLSQKAMSFSGTCSNDTSVLGSNFLLARSSQYTI